MPAKDLIFEFSEFDLNHVLADVEEIRRHNPQRNEMEQLTAIVHVDFQKNGSVGYKDLTEREFWVSGHMPGMPLMPGVIMCEAAAQLASYHVSKAKLFGDNMLGFGALDGVHFRGIVRPGDRLVIAVQLIKVRKNAMIVCRFQCFVGENLVCDGTIKGVPLPVEELRRQTAAS